MRCRVGHDSVVGGTILYSRLVRDRIPDTMAEGGLKPVTRTLVPDARAYELQRELQEEVAEYGQLARFGLAMEH